MAILEKTLEADRGFGYRGNIKRGLGLTCRWQFGA